MLLLRSFRFGCSRKRYSQGELSCLPSSSPLTSDSTTSSINSLNRNTSSIYSEEHPKKSQRIIPSVRLSTKLLKSLHLSSSFKVPKTRSFPKLKQRSCWRRSEATRMLENAKSSFSREKDTDSGVETRGRERWRKNSSGTETLGRSKEERCRGNEVVKMQMTSSISTVSLLSRPKRARA